MDWVIPAVCFFLALALLVSGFVLWNMGPPDVSLELHQARLGDDQEYRDLLESQLRAQRRWRKLLIGCLFGGSGAMVITAFLTMRPAEGRG